jgi:signal peptidase I
MMKITIKLALILLVLMALGAILIRPYRISGDCMEPAAQDGQLCFLSKLTSFTYGYQINDIILFKHEGKVWISRIVALEHDSIEITENNIILNGHPPIDTMIKRNWTNWQYGNYAINAPLQIPANHVFVLSDNLAAHHDDSRVFGPIPLSSILGTVWFCK